MVQLKHIYFIAYILIDIFHGILIGVFGPSIIYFSKVTHHDETYFSFIFFAKAIGFLIGGYFGKILPNYMAYHRIFILTISLCGFALITSSLDFGFWNLSITMILVGATSCIFQIIKTQCIFELFFQDDEQFWLQLATIFFGIGGFIGPIITLYAQELSLRAIGIMIFLCIPPLIVLRSPEIKNSGQQEQQQEKDLLQLPLKGQIFLALLIFVNIGLMAAFPSWIPTYAVKSGEFNTLSANLLVSIFWIFEILGKGTIQQKCYFLMRCILICGIFTLMMQWFGYYTICCYFGVITAGLILSPLCCLYFTLAQEHGYRLNISNTANLTVASVIAEGILVAPIGYLIQLLGFKALMYTVLVINILMYANFSYLNSYLQKDSKYKRRFLQIQN